MLGLVGVTSFARISLATEVLEVEVLSRAAQLGSYIGQHEVQQTLVEPRRSLKKTHDHSSRQ